MSAEAVGIRLTPDACVSYRRTEKEFVERFVTALEDQGPEVWLDADILAGADWRGTWGRRSSEEALGEDETTGSVAIETSTGFLIIGLLFAIVSFVIFFALSKARAKRELRAHMQIV